MAEESIGYIQNVTDELRHIRSQQEEARREMSSLEKAIRAELQGIRDLITTLQLQKLQQMELKQTTLEAAITVAEKSMERLANGQTWLIRAVVGGFIGGAIALVFKFVGP